MTAVCAPLGEDHGLFTKYYGELLQLKMTPDEDQSLFKCISVQKRGVKIWNLMLVTKGKI